MNFDQYTALGDGIRAALRDANDDYAQLPGIAAAALQRADLDETVDLRAVADFFMSTRIPQQPGTGFSNLPPVVYRCKDFYIELLFWANATTAIHQHAFSGAFRVLVGSSFHSRWRFAERDRISQRMLIGDCLFDAAEILTQGDVREIHPGREGLLHALFHLDQPSVTLVVRTASEPWAMPQYSLHPPNVAIDTHGVSNDAQIQLMQRLLALAGVLGEAPGPILRDAIARLDLPRVYVLITQLFDGLLEDDAALWDETLAAIRARFGPYADLFEGARADHMKRRALSATRETITEPDLRFFLALLLNAPSRDWIYKLTAQRYPGIDPQAFCVDALDRLRGKEKLTTAFAALAQKAQMGQFRFGARLGKAIPYPEGDAQARAALDAALAGSGQGDAALDGALRAMPELSPLFA